MKKSDPGIMRVIITNYEQADLCAKTAKSLELSLDLISEAHLVTSLGAAAYAVMISVLKDSYPNIPITGILHCQDFAGSALAGLAHGLSHVIYTGPDEIANKLSRQGIVYREPPTSLRFPIRDLRKNTSRDYAMKYLADAYHSAMQS